MAGIATSMRRLVSGSGTVTPYYVGGRPLRLAFSQAQGFHRGETITFAVIGGVALGVMTIAYGWGAEWTVHQIATHGTNANLSYKRTDPSPSRARGGAGAEPHRFVPGAMHFLYVSPINDTGAFDWYTYVDTIFPIHGVHPYTRDKWSGRSWLAMDGPCDADAALVPDTGSTQWTRTDPTASRLRGDGGGPPFHFVSGARQSLYVSPLDSAGGLDWYTYVDTVYPVRGVHPGQMDRSVVGRQGRFPLGDWCSRAGYVQPDRGTRRSTTGSVSVGAL